MIKFKISTDVQYNIFFTDYEARNTYTHLRMYTYVFGYISDNYRWKLVVRFSLVWYFKLIQYLEYYLECIQYFLSYTRLQERFSRCIANMKSNCENWLFTEIYIWFLLLAHLHISFYENSKMNFLIIFRQLWKEFHSLCMVFCSGLNKENNFEFQNIYNKCVSVKLNQLYYFIFHITCIWRMSRK